MIVNNKMDEVIMNVNVFCTCVITSILSQCDRRLTVRIERCWMSERAENFFNKSAKPNALLGGVRGSNIFGLRC